MRNACSILLIPGLLLFATACAGPQRPVLYPNEKLTAVGKEASQVDVNDCIRLSLEAGLEKQTGKEAAKEGVKEGARGAIIGAVTGNVGQATAIGAAGGAAAGFTEKAFDRELDAVQKQYVDQCLRDRGYQPIG